jgi:hypothetical protein
VLTGERVLALEIDKRLNAEKMGEKLLDSLRKLERLFSIDES